TMFRGFRYIVSVTMQNTGTTTWTAGSLYRLGSENPTDNFTWGINRVELPVSVAPGQQVTFRFSVIPPTFINALGGFYFRWRMVQDGVEHFGAYSPNVFVT